MKIKLFIYIVLIVSSFLIWNPVFASAPLADQTLKIRLNQPTPKKLTVNSIIIEPYKPEQYQLTYENTYYAFDIIDSNNAKLFSGQITYDSSILLDPANVPESHGGKIDSNNDTLVLNLPYFSEAERVKIYDEKRTLILDINLLTYGIGTTKKYAECDQCGYCKGAKVPQKWNECRACLYPSASTDPITGETLLIDDKTGDQVKPAAGAFYSELGCVNSPLGISSAQGPANLVRLVLSVTYTIVGSIGLVMLMYGAFLVLTSKGSKSQVAQGKNIIIKTIIGTVFVFSAVFIVNLLASILKIPGFGK